MIIKSFELNKVNIKVNKIILLYGKNEGHKIEIIKKLTNQKINKISHYEEKEILDNENNFI